MIPLLMVAMLGVLSVGMVFFQIGRAAVFSTEAQTAADAAALAAVKDVRAQLIEQVAATGTSDLALINPVRVRAAADSYARRNGGHATRLERRGVDVKVWVSTNQKLGEQARELRAENRRGEGRARARLDLIVMPGFNAGNLGGIVTGGVKRISDKTWEKLADDINRPPQCGTSAATNDLVKLSKVLAAHGFTVSENADFGDNPAPGVHSDTGYHYKCRNSAAIDLNVYGADEMSAIDGIIADVQRLGFRTIWRAEGHRDHAHIDLANSGSMGAGFGGGAVGALEETMLDIKLIDWDAAYVEFFAFGGGGSGTFGGPPDPGVARTICRVLDRYNASPKVRLAAFEAAIVESGVHNLNYGDRDSLGVFQQRPSQGWGTPAQILNVDYAATQFITRAIRGNQNQSAGQLAQDVQRSAFPERYDQVALQAYALLERYC